MVHFYKYPLFSKIGSSEEIVMTGPYQDKKSKSFKTIR